MAIIELDQVPKTVFSGGATYQTLVGDDAGSTPIRVGVQISPPGYSTGTHSHPYMEVVSVIEGTGEAWMDGHEGMIAIGPGSTLVMAPNVKHGFCVTGDGAMKTYGVHASAQRIVDREDS
jgi:quercetin dioxygenase-like cupin family protein